MLTNPPSAIETRRRAHRRQNSTPNIEVGQLRRLPAAAAGAGLQRTNSHRGHRRGLSLDQPRIATPARLTPTLGPISQDDIGVSNQTANHAAHFDQYHNTAVAQTSLAQPGQNQFHMLPTSLDLQSQPFSAMSQTSHPLYPNMSPLDISHAESFAGSPVSQSPLAAQNPFGPQPTMQQIDNLTKHIQSVYGHLGEVQINILPTPVSTPQKRSSVAIMENVDMGAIPLDFDVSKHQLTPSLGGADFKLNLTSPDAEPGYESSFYSSPPHSVSCSPQQPSVKSFMDNLAAGSLAVPDNIFASSQTILTDVEQPSMPFSGPHSPVHSPRPVSIADLSIDGTIEETGISNDEIQRYISQQDPSSHRWTCLYPGCDAKTFGRRENIRSHVQTHLGDRQYRCNHCGKCFVRQHDLKRHAKIHSGNKPYRCPCGGGFARQDALTRHRQRGMCVGGFPNAVRKQARRGRPRKQRPGMEERLEKAARARGRARSDSSDEGSDGEEEDDEDESEVVLDTAKLEDLPEELDDYRSAPLCFSRFDAN
jgi:regulatory protein SWI5